jgi:hypothetical protein
MRRHNVTIKDEMHGERHHSLFPREMWNASKPGKALRASQWLIPRLVHEPHADLHRAIALIPAFDFHMGSRVLSNFTPPRNYLGAIDELMFCIDEATRHPKCQIIERGVGQLAIAALEISKIHVKEGLILPS